MAGLNEEQWEEVRKRLLKVDEMHDDLLIMKTKIGIVDGNGLFGRVKKLENKPNQIRVWIPVIICVLLFCGNIFGWISDSIQEKILRQNIKTIMVSPEPTP